MCSFQGILLWPLYVSTWLSSAPAVKPYFSRYRSYRTLWAKQEVCSKLKYEAAILGFSKKNLSIEELLVKGIALQNNDYKCNTFLQRSIALPASSIEIHVIRGFSLSGFVASPSSLF